MINDQTMAEAINPIGSGYLPRTYKTRQGVALPLRPIAPMLIKQFSGDTSGKPKPPVVSVTVGKKTIQEVNEHDPDYLAALEQWETDLNERIMIYVISRGVCAEPTPHDIKRLREVSPGLTDTRLKFSWIMEMLENESEMADLMIVIMGQTVPTEQGIRAAESTFQGDDQSNGHHEVSVAESKSDD